MATCKHIDNEEWGEGDEEAKTIRNAFVKDKVYRKLIKSSRVSKYCIDLQKKAYKVALKETRKLVLLVSLI